MMKAPFLYLYTIFTLFCGIILAPAALASSGEPFSMQKLAQLPILHEGRIKPLDSVARAQQKYLSGRDDHALIWLRDTILNPAYSENQPLIKITNPDTLNMLGLTRSPSKRYAHKDVLQALTPHIDMMRKLQDTPQDQWTQAQNDIMDLQQKTVIMSDLLASLSVFLPLSARIPSAEEANITTLPQILQDFAGKPLTYWDSLKFAAPLRDHVNALAKEKGSDIESYSALDQALVHVAFSIDSLRLNGRISQDFKAIPIPNAGQNSAPWLSPWESINQGQTGPEHSALFAAWRSLATAYHSQDARAWDSAAADIITHTQTLAQSIPAPANLRTTALSLEYYFSLLSPLSSGATLYGLALFLLGLSAALQALGHTKLTAPLQTTAFATCLISGTLQTAYMLARMYILQRPPVSTLFESILFVAVLSAFITLFLYGRQNKSESAPFWLFTCAFLGLVLQILALSHDQDGDSMMMLTAVLNTNFWLATHVICIMIGYGFCVLVSMLAHYSIYQSWRSGAAITQNSVQKLLHHMALLALLFSSVGTILGGIWADQSWGRFWGWDPKENGALLITLWLIWALHGRISGQMKPLSYTITLAYLSVITGLSWFGVNLLSVGLHAYGFTQGVAVSLFTFIALQTCLLIAAYIKLRPLHKKAKS